MKKSITTISLIIMLLVIAVFAGCKDPGTYVDPLGSTYIAVTDSDGSTLLNNEGDIIVYQTGTDGETITNESGVPQTIANFFPDQIQDGDYIQTPTYTLTLPGGWMADKENAGYYTKKSDDATVQISVVSGYTLDSYKEYTLDMLKKIKESEKSGTVEYKEDSFQYTAAGTTAYSYTLTKTSDDGNLTTYMLVFKHSGNLYKILFSAPTEKVESADFTAFYSAIHYKNYQYYDTTEK